MTPLLPQLLRKHAEVRPDVAALASGNAPGLSYRAWHDRASAVAQGLNERGLGRGARVAVVGTNAAYEEFGVGYMGILVSGAAALALDGSRSQRELEESLAAASTDLVVGCTRGLELSSTTQIVDVRRLEESGWVSALPSLRALDPAELISTSGTTGVARLVEATHGNIARDFASEPNFDPEASHSVHALAPGTNVGQVALRSSLTLGCTVVALRAFELDTYVRLARSLPMRTTVLMPAMAAAIASEGRRLAWSFPDATTVVVTGAFTPQATWMELQRVFPEADLLNSYSTAEAWPARTLTVFDPENPGSGGEPADGHEVEVRGDDGFRLPRFKRGTVYLKDRATTPRRYVAKPASSTRTDGWIETDDLGYLDGQGRLHLGDRKSDVISTGGNTVSTLEVETVLAQHPQVIEAAVVGIPHPTLGSYIAAFVVSPQHPDLEDIRRLLGANLAPHQRPHRIEFRRALPRSRSGKVAKRLLRDELVDAPVGGSPPRSREEADVLSIWEAALGRRVSDIEASFFALGGDSLSALHVVARIRDELGGDLPVDALLAAPTIAQQAALIGATRRS